MFVIEGVRCSGKTFTVDVIKKNFPNVCVYKDAGLRVASDLQLDLDDYAIGRDLTYAQALPVLMDDHLADTAVFDRMYFSSYVYGIAWRKGDKQFWKEHIQRIENLYGDFLKKIHFILLDLPTDAELDRIKKMRRQKDKWDKTLDFKRQYRLYLEIVNKITKAKVTLLPSFQSEDFIVKFFKEVFNPR